jgi:hypothetical protein
MLARRLLILMAVMFGLTALAAGVTPRSTPERGPVASAPPSRPVAPPMERTLDAAGSGQTVVVEAGQPLVLTVTGEELATVSIAEFGNAPVEASSPARFDLLVDVPGTYPIELLESGVEIGTLEVRPAGDSAPGAGDAEPS